MTVTLKKDHKSTIIAKGDKVIKTFGRPMEFIDEEWLRHYKTFHKMYGGVVRVHDADKNHIVMDFVEGSTLNDTFWKEKGLDHKLGYEAFAAILSCLSHMSEYSSTIDRVWFHNDAGMHNYVVSNGHFILVDPDAFKLTRNPYPGTFVSHLHPLVNVLRCLYDVHEKKYFFEKSEKNGVHLRENRV